jgi:hypothetical protein
MLRTLLLPQACLNTTYGLGEFERAYKASAADIYTAHKLIKVRV